jgi:hypothetical protein
MAATPASEQGALGYYAGKVARHLRWARSEGIGRLIEEDRLDPRERVATAYRKARWRRRSGVAPGTARPVYVVGLQRSGTNMLMRGIDLAPEVEVRNENDRTVFHRFQLRSDDVLTRTITSSRHAIVLVKPLCESHRVDQLLDLPGTPPGRALWVFREPVARARSEVSKFRDANLRALRAVAAGEGDAIWQGQRLPAESVALVRSFDTDSMSPESAAVLFWVVRNQLYFDLGLDQRPDVLPVSYDAFVADPAGQMSRLCAFIGLPCRPALFEHVVARESHGTRPLPVEERVADLGEAPCEPSWWRRGTARGTRPRGRRGGIGRAGGRGRVPGRRRRRGRRPLGHCDPHTQLRQRHERTGQHELDPGAERELRRVDRSVGCAFGPRREVGLGAVHRVPAVPAHARRGQHLLRGRVV